MDADATPVLRGERVVLRPVAEADLATLAAILREPEVAAWWGDYTEERARAELTTDPGWAIEVDGAVAGWLTVTEETEPDYRHVGFDIFLATAVRGRGLGREALGLAVRHFAARGHHRFTIDPALANERAIRSYAAVGFRPVGVMRAVRARAATAPGTTTCSWTCWPGPGGAAGSAAGGAARLTVRSAAATTRNATATPTMMTGVAPGPDDAVGTESKPSASGRSSKTASWSSLTTTRNAQPASDTGRADDRCQQQQAQEGPAPEHRSGIGGAQVR